MSKKPSKKKLASLKRKVEAAERLTDRIVIAEEIHAAGDSEWSRRLLKQALGDSLSFDEDLHIARLAHRCGWGKDEVDAIVKKARRRVREPLEWIDVAEHYAKMGDRAQALAALRKAYQRLNKADYVTANDWIILARYMGDPDLFGDDESAMKALEKALEWTGFRGEGHWLQDVLEAIAKLAPERARELYEAIFDDVTSGSTRVTMAESALNVELIDRDQAVKVLWRVLEEMPEGGYEYDGGNCMYDLGRAAKSLDHLELVKEVCVRELYLGGGALPGSDTDTFSDLIDALPKTPALKEASVGIDSEGWRRYSGLNIDPDDLAQWWFHFQDPEAEGMDADGIYLEDYSFDLKHAAKFVSDPEKFDLVGELELLQAAESSDAGHLGLLTNAQILDRWGYSERAKQLVEKILAESKSPDLLRWLALVAQRNDSLGGETMSRKALARATSL